jgi:CheY-like chemotaxis protein
VGSHEILLVDDDPAILRVVGQILEDIGYQVTMESSGESAVEVLGTRRFDLVITDLDMRPTDGFAVLREAKGQNPEVMVILFTGDQVTSSHALSLGFDDCISKPCRMDGLLTRVADCLERSERKHRPFQERRSQPRYTVRKITSYCHEGKRYLTLTRDLGLGGMKIETHHDLPKDEHTDIRVVLGAGFICPKGRIAHSGFLSNNRSVSGVEFLELSEQDHTSLQRSLAALEN